MIKIISINLCLFKKYALHNLSMKHVRKIFLLTFIFAMKNC